MSAAKKQCFLRFLYWTTFSLKQGETRSNSLPIPHPLILPYINYGVLIWGNTCKIYLNKIFKLQKWAIRTISNSYYRSHTGSLFSKFNILKGCGMGPWLVLVSPCFRENVVATWKIGSFLCSLGHLLQINVIVLFFGNQVSNGTHLKNGLFLTYFSHFLVTKEKLQKFLQHISQTHTCTYFAHPIDFFALPILKKIQIYQVRFLFGMSPQLVLVLILICTILEQSINNKMVSKI